MARTGKIAGYLDNAGRASSSNQLHLLSYTLVDDLLSTLNATITKTFSIPAETAAEG